MWLFVTLASFWVARLVSAKLNHPLANPLLISLFIVIPLLLITDTSYQTYYHDNEIFMYLLQPAVVALAYPLYEQAREIRANWKIIFLACGVGSVLSMFTASVIAVFLNTDIPLIASILGKSVTTPIAMEVSSHLGGEPAIAAIMVLIVGVFGAIFAYPIYNLVGITHPIARGLTMGTVSHALGTATCLEKNPKEGAFSSLALVLCGVITSFLAPAFYALVEWLHIILNG
ncbi:CidB/LrgB family autolysis modulator [Vibrio hannami]|uniref:CidB/LrgB family autolysis modulator n=1 Tax=Vibrio hannami TaxID=2717094 RepID=UPI00240F457C|nr:CidB/LrgB family autolysis modulator [Vibrio hannami]MDG3088020.1 CidB/LrgB family autolysis modulator [Vibrio hannami]